MGGRLKKLWIIGMAAVCILTACGKKEKESAVELTETPEPTSVAVSTPVAMEVDGEVTPSGIKVSSKICKYKVIQGVNLRSDCSGESELKGSLQPGEVLQGTGVCENGWIQLVYEGERCYATGSCFEETDDRVTSPGTETEPSVTAAPSMIPGEGITPPATETPAATVDVTDWAKYTSSYWQADGLTSCFVQIRSIAGNQAVFRFQVIDGALEDAESSDTLVAEADNCNGKIENGIMNFSFTDNYGNVGLGTMEIVDEKHLRITTVISQPAPNAAYAAAVMTELTERE